MAHSIEARQPQDIIAPQDLLNEGVVDELLSQGRKPFFMRNNDDTVACFVPPLGLGEGQTMDYSLTDAKEIATIIDKLSREV